MWDFFILHKSTHLDPLGFLFKIFLSQPSITNIFHNNIGGATSMDKSVLRNIIGIRRRRFFSSETVNQPNLRLYQNDKLFGRITSN